MILDYSCSTKSIQEAYKNIQSPKTYEIVTEGGLGIVLGALGGFLVGGPIAAIAGAYLGHKAEEIGVSKFLKNMLFITGGALVGTLGGPLGTLAGGIGGHSLAKKYESVEQTNDKVITEKDDTEQKSDLGNEFKQLFKALDLFLKEKSSKTLKQAYEAIGNINKDSIVNKLDKATKDRLVKIYIYLTTLYALQNKTDNESKQRYNKIISTFSKDIAAAAANILSKSNK